MVECVPRAPPLTVERLEYVDLAGSIHLLKYVLRAPPVEKIFPPIPSREEEERMRQTRLERRRQVSAKYRVAHPERVKLAAARYRAAHPCPRAPKRWYIHHWER